MERKKFLELFLKIYDVAEIEISSSFEDKIYGTAKYQDHFVEDDFQEFCWHISEDMVPSENAIVLVKNIVAKNLHQGDKIIVSDEELFLKSEITNRINFDHALNEIFNIEIKMIDDGEETDSYFIHY